MNSLISIVFLSCVIYYAACSSEGSGNMGSMGGSNMMGSFNLLGSDEPQGRPVWQKIIKGGRYKPSVAALIKKALPACTMAYYPLAAKTGANDIGPRHMNGFITHNDILPAIGPFNIRRGALQYPGYPNFIEAGKYVFLSNLGDKSFVLSLFIKQNKRQAAPIVEFVNADGTVAASLTITDPTSGNQEVKFHIPAGTSPACTASNAKAACLNNDYDWRQVTLFYTKPATGNPTLKMYCNDNPGSTVTISLTATPTPDCPLQTTDTFRLGYEQGDPLLFNGKLSSLSITCNHPTADPIKVLRKLERSSRTILTLLASGNHS